MFSQGQVDPVQLPYSKVIEIYKNSQSMMEILKILEGKFKKKNER